MPYFPEKTDSAYKCQGCGQWYILGNVSCCVAHSPGTCCHYGETPTTPPVKFGGNTLDFTELAVYSDGTELK